MKKGGLGKGLDSLITKNENNNVSRETLLRLSEIEPNREQPRKKFDEDSIEELAASIKEHGLIQPIIVVKKQDYYMIVAGERRWRAAKIAGLNKVPVVVKGYDDREVSEIALIENIQRESLNPIEEAEGINSLMERYNLKQEELAQIVSKSRPYITNSLRLLKLDKKVQEFVSLSKISTGHARCLVTLDDTMQIEVAKNIIDKGLSVRETEDLINKLGKEKPTTKKKSKDNEILHIEQILEEKFHTKIEIKNSPKNKGKITINYSNLNEFERILDILRGVND